MKSGFKRQVLDLGITIVIAVGVLYFGQRAIQGESGLFASLALETEQTRLIAELTTLQSERQRLENLTKRLGEGYLDLDLLDERARDVLGYVRSDEVVIR
ncbi:MAG: FtsB family cell division protein [Pikeienuella sp.]